MPPPKIYGATEAASQLTDVPPLPAGLVSTKIYCDKITRSAWWRTNLHPNLRVGVGLSDLSYSRVVFEEDTPPLIEFSQTPLYLSVPTYQDPWVVLHELAHVATIHNPGYHGKEFCVAFWGLVWRYLGDDVAQVLKAEMRHANIRLNYRLL